MRSRANGPACDAALQARRAHQGERADFHVVRQFANRARWRTRRCGSSRRCVVRPRICANGSTTVSMPIATSASMVTVSGFSMVTPASMSSRTLAVAQQAVHLGQFQRGC